MKELSRKREPAARSRSMHKQVKADKRIERTRDRLPPEPRLTCERSWRRFTALRAESREKRLAIPRLSERAECDLRRMSEAQQWPAACSCRTLQPASSRVISAFDALD